MKGYIIIAVGLIGSSLLLSADKLYELSQDSNVINLTSGKVRLGEVYSENLSTTFTVKLDGSDSYSLNVKSDTVDLYDSAYKEFKDMVDGVNKLNKKKKEELLSLDSVSWNKDAVITMKTVVTYKSKYQPFFTLSIDNSEEIYLSKDGGSILDVINNLKPYSNKMSQLYRTNNSFIN